MRYVFKVNDPEKAKGDVNIAGHIFHDGAMEYESAERPENMIKVLGFYGVELQSTETKENSSLVEKLKKATSELEQMTAEKDKLAEELMALREKNAAIDKTKTADAAPAAKPSKATGV